MIELGVPALFEPGSPAPRIPVRRGPIVTYALLMLIGAIFIWLETHGGTTNSAVLHRAGALYPPAVLAAGESWRLLTAIFLHQGIVHVSLNSWVLLQMGTLVEALFGHWRFALIYITAGVSGALASLAFGSMAGSVGASGAIFGLFGAVVFWRLADRRARYVPWTSLLWPIAINLSIGLVVPNIDNWGHVGGLAGGVVAGALVGLPPGEQTWVYGPRPFSVAWRRSAAILLIVLIVAVVAGRLPLPVAAGRADWARGIAALEAEEPARAEALFRSAARALPHSADVRALWGISLYYLDRVDAAEEQLRQALQINPKHDLARRVLTIVNGQG